MIHLTKCIPLYITIGKTHPILIITLENKSEKSNLLLLNPKILFVSMSKCILFGTYPVGSLYNPQSESERSNTLSNLIDLSYCDALFISIFRDKCIFFFVLFTPH